MKRHLLITSLIAIAGATRLSAQQPPAETEVGAAKLALVNLPAKGNARLTVTTPPVEPPRIELRKLRRVGGEVRVFDVGDGLAERAEPGRDARDDHLADA